LKSFLQMLPRIAAAAAFTAATTIAVVLAGAANAGSAPTAPFSAAPQRADAAVFVGVAFGNYPRWRWDGYRRSWVRFGFAYGAPGYVANVGYVGYAPPPGPPYWAAPVVYSHPYYRPAWHPYYRQYWHPYYGPAWGWHRGWERGWHRGWR